jgi:hypothetical protein
LAFEENNTFATIWMILVNNGKSGKWLSAKLMSFDGWRADKAQIHPAKGD